MSTETLALQKRRAARTAGRARPSRCAAPVLDQEPNRLGQLLAELAGRGHPIRTFLLGIVLTFGSVAGLSILLGLLVTRVIVHDSGIGSADERFVRVLADHRSSGLTSASLVGSIIGGGVVLPIVVGVCGLLAAAFRQWRLGVFLIFALGLESASYRVTTLLVHRHRPEVHRLENLQVNASYPSGHTAAAIAVYCGLALLLTSRIRRSAPRVAVWAAAASIPVYVGFARMYRGMHHPSDVLGGVFIGVLVLVAMVVVSRAVGWAAAELRGS